MIATYSVNFDLIHKSFKLLAFIKYHSVWKKFKAIASAVVLVGVAKNCKRFFSNICIDFFNRYKLQLLE